MEDFKGLFSQEGSEEEDGSNESDFFQHWGWVATLDRLSMGDRTKWDYYLELNARDFCSWMSYLKDKAEMEKEIYLKEKAKRGIK